MAKRSTKALMEQRIGHVVELTLACASYSEIIRFASENWHITSRQADTYIKKAKERIKNEAKQRMADGIDSRIMMMYSDRKNALRAGDKRLAFNILTKICELAGDFNHPQNLTIKNNISGKLNIDIEPIDTDYRNAIEPLAPLDDK